MKTFNEYLAENFRTEVVPAIRDKEGKIHRGKRGEDHEEIRQRKMTEPGKPLEGEAGFYHRNHGFMTRKEMGGVDSTRLLTPKEREARDKRKGTHEEDPFAGSYSTTDKMSDLQRMRKYGNLEEGNPLSRMHGLEKEGRHFIAISTERPGLSKKEVSQRNKKLVSLARANGFGVRKAEGHYEGSKETSHIIHAKSSGREAGSELVAFGRKMGQHFDQDSVLHHNGKTARLIGTNETGYPGKDKSEKVGGKLKYNNTKSPFQTELRPSKKRSSARFTTE